MVYEYCVWSYYMYQHIRVICSAYHHILFLTAECRWWVVFVIIIHIAISMVLSWVSSWLRAIARVHPVHLMNTDSAEGGRQPQTKPNNLGCNSAGRLQPSSLLLLGRSWYSFYSFHTVSIGNRSANLFMSQLLLIPRCELTGGQRVESPVLQLITFHDNANA